MRNCYGQGSNCLVSFLLRLRCDRKGGGRVGPVSRATLGARERPTLTHFTSSRPANEGNTESTKRVTHEQHGCKTKGPVGRRLFAAKKVGTTANRECCSLSTHSFFKALRWA